MKLLASNSQHVNLTSSLINQLIIKEELLPEDLSGLSDAQKNKMLEALYQRVAICQPHEKRSILNKMAALSGDPEVRNEIWEVNHRSILSAIAKHLSTNGCMPGQTLIAEKTELSRKCVARHLAEYRDSELYTEQMKKLQMMKLTVVELILSQAVQGDLKAARMYVELLSKMEDKEEARKERQKQKEKEKGKKEGRAAQGSAVQRTGVPVHSVHTPVFRLKKAVQKLPVWQKRHANGK